MAVIAKNRWDFEEAIHQLETQVFAAQQTEEQLRQEVNNLRKDREVYAFQWEQLTANHEQELHIKDEEINALKKELEKLKQLQNETKKKEEEEEAEEEEEVDEKKIGKHITKFKLPKELDEENVTKGTTSTTHIDTIQSCHGSKKEKLKELEQNYNIWNKETEKVIEQYQNFEKEAENFQDPITVLKQKELVYQNFQKVPQDKTSDFRELTQQLREIKTTLQQLRTKINEEEKELLETEKKYANQVEKQNQTYKDFLNMYFSYKQIIEHHNELLILKINQIRNLSASQQELLYIEELEQSCTNLLKSFYTLHQHFEEYMDKLKKHLEDEWENLKKRWSEWEPKIIVLFIQKILDWWDLNKYEVVLKTMQQTLESKEINGSNLKEVQLDILMNVLSLSLPNASKVNIAFQKLFEKYPIIPAISSANVPKEYLCPISKKIMEDPVIALDSMNYDRSSVPINAVESEDPRFVLAGKLLLITNKPLKDEINLFLKMNPSFVLEDTVTSSNESSAHGINTIIEGENETVGRYSEIEGKKA